MKTTAVIVAAGTSDRLPGAVPKQYRLVAGRPVLAHTLRRFDKCGAIDDIVLVVAEDYLLYATEAVVDRFDIKKVEKVVPGGNTRFESVMLGLSAISEDCEIVVIHDGVRPMIRPEVISQVVAMCGRENAVALGVALSESVKRVEDTYVLATLDERRLFSTQTPQAFEKSIALDSFARASQSGREYADDAAVVEAAGHKVKILESDQKNLKITLSHDLEVMRFLMTIEKDSSDVRA